MISAVILTKNEEKNIVRCLKSLRWCEEIVIIDDYSSDNTIKNIQISKYSNIQIFRRRLNNNFAGQRNYGLFKAKGEWILFIDADEIVTPALRREIIQYTNIQIYKYCGFMIKRRDYFLGRELKYGETGNIKLLRLARKNSGKWHRKVHEYWSMKGETGELKNPILHYHTRSLSDFVKSINIYSDMHALELKREGKKSNLFKIIIWPTGKFFYNYVFKLGLMDGVEGFIMAVMMSFHSFLAWSKRWIS